MTTLTASSSVELFGLVNPKDKFMRCTATVLILVCSLLPRCYADESKVFGFEYKKHYANEPHKPEPFATGKLTITFPSMGTNISINPFRSSAEYKMTATASDDTREWAMANNAKTAYSFAYSLNGGTWTTSTQIGPDSFKPNKPSQQKVGEWTVDRNVNLQFASTQPQEMVVELYVSCCGCNPDLNIPPPSGYANLCVSVKIKWVTDEHGVVTSSDVTDFKVEQSTQLDTGNPIYARRGDGGWDCNNLITNPSIISMTSPFERHCISAQSTCGRPICRSQSCCCRRPRRILRAHG